MIDYVPESEVVSYGARAIAIDDVIVPVSEICECLPESEIEYIYATRAVLLEIYVQIEIIAHLIGATIYNLRVRSMYMLPQ